MCKGPKELEEALRRAEFRSTSLFQHLGVAEAALAEREAALAAIQTELAAAKSELVDKAHSLAAMHSALRDKEHRIADLLSSSSWKMTAPIRWAKRRLG